MEAEPAKESSHVISSQVKDTSSDITQLDDNPSQWQQIVKNISMTKSYELIMAQSEETQMKRTLGAFDLVMIGIGCIIGTGIFVLTGHAAAVSAGPAVVFSFIIAGIVSMFAALCYAEMASMIPISGSAYTYAYATMGELVAWTIGWDLILEYLVGAATVSVGWSGYVVAFIESVSGYTVPSYLIQPPIRFDIATESFIYTGDFINLPAVFIILTCTTVLVFGTKNASWVNTIIVIVKTLVVVIFIVATIKYINPDNWEPFVPENTGKFGRFGVSGIFQAATMVFFAYIGFDSVSTTAQECRNPQRDLPIGIIVSLVVCTVLYVLVCLCLTGIVPYTELNVPHPIAVGIEATGLTWLIPLVNLGAIAGLTSVILVLLLGQPRIFYAMAHDGFFPEYLAKIHPTYGTPWMTTIVSGVVCSILAGLLPIDILGEIASIGTLLAFVLVCFGVMILRIRRPDIPRKFKAPLGDYFVPLTGALFSLILIFTATSATIVRLFIWMAIGMLLYIFYGYRHSKQRIENQALFESP